MKSYNEVVQCTGGGVPVRLDDARSPKTGGLLFSPPGNPWRELLGMRDRRIVVEVQIMHEEGIIAQRGDGITNNPMEAGGVLVGITHALRTPQVVAVHGVPFSLDVACEA